MRLEGCRHTSEPNIFWVWVARDPFNAGISLRLLVSTKTILGTRAGTFTERVYDYTLMSLIYIDLLEKYGGGTGIRTLEGCYTLLVFKTSAFNRSAIPPDRRMMTKAALDHKSFAA